MLIKILNNHIHINEHTTKLKDNRWCMKESLTRMSIDISRKDHKKIKMTAAKEGVSIRQFVIGCVQDKIGLSSQEPSCKRK